MRTIVRAYLSRTPKSSKIFYEMLCCRHWCCFRCVNVSMMVSIYSPSGKCQMKSMFRHCIGSYVEVINGWEWFGNLIALSFWQTGQCFIVVRSNISCSFVSLDVSRIGAEIFIRGATTEGVSSCLSSHRRDIESAITFFEPAIKRRL